MAFNALSDDDQCPICCIQWPNFVEPSIVAILPCAHACCAACLTRFHDQCVLVESEKEENPDFKCVLCRKEISKLIIQNLAEELLEKKIISSFNQLAKNLPYNKREFKELVISLLTQKYEFDISKVENALFNIVGLIDRKDQSEQLDHEKKQEYYKSARMPVNKLQEEFEKERESLLDIYDNESVEWKSRNNKLNELKKQLNFARENAANDIFERMNSFGKMGVELINDDDESNGTVHIDMHGLHITEAKERFKQFILPILPLMKRVIVITGHGAHSKTNQSVLKESLKEYFESMDLRSKELSKNKGAICVYGYAKI